MKKLIIVMLVLGLLTFCFVLTLVVSAAPSKGFTGAWKSVDVDGSNQKMSISGGGSGVYHILLRDDGGTVCGPDPQGNLYPLIGLGEGSAVGNVLETEVTVWCLKKPKEYQDVFPITFIYNAADDTLEQYVPPPWDDTVIWYRMGTK